MVIANTVKEMLVYKFRFLFIQGLS